MATQSGTMTGCAHNSHDLRERKNCLIGSRAKFRPVSRMNFRPEEMDTASCKGPILCPLAQRDIYIAMDTGGCFIFYDPVTNNNPHRFSAIQARRVNLHSSSREYPADRQGFKSSLCKPFLLTVNSNPVLRRLIVEWREGGNEVGSRVKPHRHT